MSSRPQIYYNSVTNRWEILSKGGVVSVSVSDTGVLRNHRGGVQASTGTIGNLNIGSTATVQQLAVGGGTTLTNMLKIVGSAAAITVGSQGIGLGSIAATGVRANDVVFASCRTAIPSYGISGFRASGSNNVNFIAVNPHAIIGSIDTATWDVTAIRA